MLFIFFIIGINKLFGLNRPNEKYVKEHMYIAQKFSSKIIQHAGDCVISILLIGDIAKEGKAFFWDDLDIIILVKEEKYFDCVPKIRKITERINLSLRPSLVISLKCFSVNEIEYLLKVPKLYNKITSAIVLYGRGLSANYVSV